MHAPAGNDVDEVGRRRASGRPQRRARSARARAGHQRVARRVEVRPAAALSGRIAVCAALPVCFEPTCAAVDNGEMLARQQCQQPLGSGGGLLPTDHAAAVSVPRDSARDAALACGAKRSLEKARWTDCSTCRAASRTWGRAANTAITATVDGANQGGARYRARGAQPPRLQRSAARREPLPARARFVKRVCLLALRWTRAPLHDCAGQSAPRPVHRRSLTALTESRGRHTSTQAASTNRTVALSVASELSGPSWGTRRLTTLASPPGRAVLSSCPRMVTRSTRVHWSSAEPVRLPGGSRTPP
jgi:hypothetical protein